MQHQHAEDLINALPANMSNNSNNNSNNLPHASPDDVEIDLEASFSRIGALSESLAALTRKRPAGEGSRRAPKRPSIGSSVASSTSFGIDALVSDLEGLEFDIMAGGGGTGCETPMGDLSISRLSMNDSMSSLVGNGNQESTTSRLSMGLWSLQDMEPWACATCTFENEPISGVCEMCGQSRPRLMRDESATTVDHCRRMDSSVRVMQEQRMYELQQSRQQQQKPTAVKASRRSKSPRPPLSSARRSHSPKPPCSGSSTPKAAAATTGRRSPKRHGSTPRRHGSSQATASLSMSGHSSLNPSLHSLSSREPSMRDLSDSSHNPVPNSGKARRFDDSFTTTTTFDMSASSFDYFPPERITYPGIAEEGEVECLEPNSAEC